jgi:hypothetical protein
MYLVDEDGRRIIPIEWDELSEKDQAEILAYYEITA